MSVASNKRIRLRSYLTLLLIIFDFLYYYYSKQYTPAQSLFHDVFFVFTQSVIWIIILLFFSTLPWKQEMVATNHLVTAEQSVDENRDQSNSTRQSGQENIQESRYIQLIFRNSRVRRSLAIIFIVLIFFSYGATYQYSSPAPQPTSLIDGHTDFHPVYTFKISVGSYGVVANQYTTGGDVIMFGGSYFLTVTDGKITSQEHLSNDSLRYVGQISGNVYFQDIGFFSLIYNLSVQRILVFNIDQRTVSSVIDIEMAEIMHQMELRNEINSSDTSIQIHFLSSMIINNTIFLILRYYSNYTSSLSPKSYLIMRYDNGNYTDFFQMNKMVLDIKILDDQTVLLLETHDNLSDLAHYSSNMTLISISENFKTYAPSFCGDLICFGGDLLDLNNTVIYSSGHNQIDSVLYAGDRIYIEGSGYVQIIEKDTYTKIYEFKIGFTGGYSILTDNQLIIGYNIYPISIQSLEVSYYLQVGLRILSWIATITCLFILIVLFDPKR